MNLEDKKQVYEVIMLFWSALKDFIFVEKIDFDKYVDAIDSKYKKYEAGEKCLFNLYRDIAIAFARYLEGKQ